MFADFFFANLFFRIRLGVFDTFGADRGLELNVDSINDNPALEKASFADSPAFFPRIISFSILAPALIACFPTFSQN